MSALADFLQTLLTDGTITYREAPAFSTEADGAAREVLARAFADYRLHVAGPAVAFAPGPAQAAAELVRQAGWFLFSRQEHDAELDRRLAMPEPPRSAACHLSADLTLRYLPQVHRRAQALAPTDRLVSRLAAVFGQWPLTGVLSVVQEGPETPPEFDGHPGLLLLYAERLAENEKRRWVPAGPAREYVELVYAGLGKRPPAPPADDVKKEDAGE